MKKILLLVLLPIFLVLAGFIYYRFYFVFGEGVKSGELNYVVNKGYVFKTYEGKMIQSGFKSSQSAGSIQSNEFIFSIEDAAVAQKLMTMGGRQIDLYYKEYLHTLPWRGNSNFVVDSFLVKLESLTMSKSEMTLQEGDAETLVLTLHPEDATTKEVHWTSSNEKIATVDAYGSVVALESGKTVIYASVEGKTASCYLTVVKRRSLEQSENPAALPQNTGADESPTEKIEL